MARPTKKFRKNKPYRRAAKPADVSPKGETPARPKFKRKPAVVRTTHPSMEAFKWKEGQSPSTGAPKGMRLMTRVRQLLSEPSDRYPGRPRFDEVAETFVRQLVAGEFNFHKEFIEREEGKVPNRIADAEGKNLKLYANVPTEGEQAP